MANARDEGRNFLRVYNLENFKIFNPRYKECLTGREWAMLMYLLNNRLLYIRRDEDFMNGNWIKMDAKEKDKLMKTLDVTLNSYERLISKLVSGGIFYRIRKDFFCVNPYCFAKGRESDVTFARKHSYFRPETISLGEDESVFLIDEKKNERYSKWQFQELENVIGEMNCIQKKEAEEIQENLKSGKNRQDFKKIAGCNVLLPA